MEAMLISSECWMESSRQSTASGCLLGEARSPVLHRRPSLRLGSSSEGPYIQVFYWGCVLRITAYQ